MNKIYICSDIHGDLPGYRRLLDTIEFDDSDKMIIAGDVLDRGEYGIELFDYAYNRDNVTMLLGNHELFAIMYLQSRLSARDWVRFGGEQTLRSITAMTSDERQNLLDRLLGLDLFEEIDSATYGKTIVTHTGIDLDNLVYDANGKIDVKASIIAGFTNNTYSYMCGQDIHDAPASILKELSNYMIVGHVPVNYINDDRSFFAYKGDYYMDIDCGRGKMKNGSHICCYDVILDKEIYID